MTQFYDSGLWQNFDLGHPGGEDATRSLVVRSGLQKGAHILDLCCGNGDSVQLLTSLGMDTCGVDRTSVIERAKDKYPKLRNDRWAIWQGGEGEALPFQDKSFDAVLCECSLSLFEKEDDIVQEVHRVLKRNGLFLVSDVCDGAPFDLPGFCRLEWQDEDEALKHFIIRWIWETGDPFPDSGRGKHYFSAVYRAQ